MDLEDLIDRAVERAIGKRAGKLARPAPEGTVWLTRKEAAEHTKLSEDTLARMGDSGPPFVKLGECRHSPVRYRKDLLDAWMNGHMAKGN